MGDFFLFFVSFPFYLTPDPAIPWKKSRYFLDMEIDRLATVRKEFAWHLLQLTPPSLVVPGRATAV